MYVSIGTHYDLRHLNEQTYQTEAQAAQPSEKLFAIPTQFVFRWLNGELKAALRIQVVAI